MRYKTFSIRNYRAITGPLVVDFEKNRLVPVIGINECGKTTILHAIFAFDYFNDLLNDRGRHLRDTANLYGTSTVQATVSAVIELSSGDFESSLNLIDDKTLASGIKQYFQKRRRVPNTLTVTRNLITKQYRIDANELPNNKLNDLLARAFIKQLPYILFFDDFRDSVEEMIEIKQSEEGQTITGWLSIVEQLFQQTDKTFSVFQLAGLEERRRKTILAKVRRHLNNTLTKEWQNFRLDESDALQISIEYYQKQEPAQVAVKPSPPSNAPNAVSAAVIAPQIVTKDFIKLEVVETDLNGDAHYFFIRDRSKGFFWFFNFVMKLQFNPKLVSNSEHTGAIYLLDEPGSYLHASAQSKLCQKLKQLSVRNTAVYCTHSHYLLDPEIIPLSSIRVADKSGNGNVELVAIHAHPGSILERRSAFQPIIDALQIKPFLLDLSHQSVVIAEGIYDYYALEMFKGGRNINVLPSVGADSVRFYVSLMIAWRIAYLALWDNDAEGRKQRRRAAEIFGELESEGRFYLLPSDGGDRIMQNLIAGSDLRMIRQELQISSSSAFEKTLASLFYSPDRQTIFNKISVETKSNFDSLFKALGLGD